MPKYDKKMYNFFLAERSWLLLILRRDCNYGGGDLLPRQPVPGPPDHLGRRLDAKRATMGGLEIRPLLLILSDIWRIKP